MTLLTDQRRDRRDAERLVLAALPPSELTAQTRLEIANATGLSADWTLVVLNRLRAQGKGRRIRSVNPSNAPGPRTIRYWLAQGADYATRRTQERVS